MIKIKRETQRCPHASSPCLTATLSTPRASEVRPRSWAAIFAWTGDIHRQCASLKIIIVEKFNRLGGSFGGTHIHEGETARFTGEFVHHHARGSDCSRLGEMRENIRFSGI